MIIQPATGVPCRQASRNKRRHPHPRDAIAGKLRTMRAAGIPTAAAGSGMGFGCFLADEHRVSPGRATRRQRPASSLWTRQRLATPNGKPCPSPTQTRQQSAQPWESPTLTHPPAKRTPKESPWPGPRFLPFALLWGPTPRVGCREMILDPVDDHKIGRCLFEKSCRAIARVRRPPIEPCHHRGMHNHQC